ncbi:MAG: hypothetical protein WCI92_03975 [Bacteroidota bacterium]
MEIIASSNTSGKSFLPVDAGNYVARCYSMVHIGTIPEEYKGEKKETNKIRLTFELPTETKVFREENGEQPYVISKEFTLSLHEKSSLRKFLESWRGKSFTESEAKYFDVSKLLGKPCMLNVIHKLKLDGNIRADISSVSPIPKGLTCPNPVQPQMIFSVNHFSQEIFDTLPEFLRDKIKSSREYKQLSVPVNEVVTPPEHAAPIDPDPIDPTDEPNDLPF